MLNGEVSVEESRLGPIVEVYKAVARGACPEALLVQNMSEAVSGEEDLVQSELMAVDDLVVVSRGNLILDYAHAAAELRVEEAEWAEEVDDVSSPRMQAEGN
jgi:propanediol dehydratase large subunit